MEAYLDGIPRSTSSGSLSNAATSSTSYSNSTSTQPQLTGSSSFWLGGISSAWSRLQAAAGVEVKGFLKAVTSAASAVGEGAGAVEQTANTGDKRNRPTNESERAREKRRRLERQQEELLSDQVPPLMPPISPAPRSSRPRHHQTPSSASPETTRKRLRPYADPSYADELMHTNQWAPSHSRKASLSGDKAGGGGLRSLSGKRRLDANGSAPVSNDSALTTAISSTRSRSLLQQRGGGHHHVKFAFSPPPTTPGLARPKSPTSRLPKREPEQVGSMLMTNVVGQVWKEAKEKEKTVKTQKKIEDLENEVVRLKTELSSKLVPPPLPAPPKSPGKSARRSVAPPPPAPPLPPVGHPLLFTARASLRATPPRPSISSSQKRRSSAIGGVQDMDAFLGELREKRGKLRKVGLPSKERKSSSKKGEGELTEVLQKAFARKFAKTNGLTSPSFDTSIQSSKSTNNLQVPQWSASASTLSSSRSHPTQLSSLSHSLSSDRFDTLPPQPIFHSSSSSSATATTSRPPRSTSLACTETTVFGQAVSIDEPPQSSGNRSRSASRSHELYLAASTATLSPSFSTTSLPSVPPEELEPRSHPPHSPPHDSPPSVIPASSNTTPDRWLTKRGEGEEIPEGGEPNSSASQRLSAARKRTSLERLPGLDAGIKRPVTPGRSRSKSNRKGTVGSSPLVIVKTEECEGQANEIRRNGGARFLQGSPSRHSVMEDDILEGKGMKSPQPQKPFGKA
ncbi:hypothetical protein JCM5350_000237 [Sporobolomyces pararoseus]